MVTFLILCFWNLNKYELVTVIYLFLSVDLLSVIFCTISLPFLSFFFPFCDFAVIYSIPNFQFYGTWLQLKNSRESKSDLSCTVLPYRASFNSPRNVLVTNSVIDCFLFVGALAAYSSRWRRGGRCSRARRSRTSWCWSSRRSGSRGRTRGRGYRQTLSLSRTSSRSASPSRWSTGSRAWTATALICWPSFSWWVSRGSVVVVNVEWILISWILWDKLNNWTELFFPPFKKSLRF